MSLESLNKRIKTTTDLRDIVSTMKMLSSVSIGPYEKALVSLREYAKTVEDAFLGLILNGGIKKPVKPSDKMKIKVLALLIGTDNGLVGKFNRDVLNTARDYFKEQNISDKNISYLCVGKRLGIMTQNAAGTALKSTYAISNSLKEIAEIATSVLVKIDELLRMEGTSQVIVFHTLKDVAAPSRVVHTQLMPLPYDHFMSLKKQKWESRSVPMIPTTGAALFSALSREYLTVVLAGSLTASLAAEHYARMINMQQAEKNIDKSLEDMNLTYQQARQTDITDELIDIVSGAEAMKITPKKRQFHDKASNGLTKSKKVVKNKKNISTKG